MNKQTTENVEIQQHLKEVKLGSGGQQDFAFGYGSLQYDRGCNGKKADDQKTVETHQTPSGPFTLSVFVSVSVSVSVSVYLSVTSDIGVSVSVSVCVSVSVSVCHL